jgi:hypothetical protein
LREHFDLGPDARMTVTVNDPSLGRVRVNSLRLSASDRPWEGDYFHGIPIEVEAIPAPGCEFVAWEGVANAPALASIRPTGDMSLQARFRRADGTIGPWPHAVELWQGEYRFEAFPADTAPGDYPPGMVFLLTPTRDPGLEADFDNPWVLPYDLPSRSRVRGLDGRGFSFLNTGNPQESTGAGYLGTALLALRTEGVRNLQVSWVGGTVSPGERHYALRLQYRLGTSGSFLEVTDAAGQAVEYQRSEIAGAFQAIGPVQLPAAAEGQPVVHLRWVYHRVPGGLDSGTRDELRVDDIRVWGQPAAPALYLETESGTGRGVFVATGVFGRPALLQSSVDLVAWTTEAVVPGTLEGRITVPMTFNELTPARFFRLWYP